MINAPLDRDAPHENIKKMSAGCGFGRWFCWSAFTIIALGFCTMLSGHGETPGPVVYGLGITWLTLPPLSSKYWASLFQKLGMFHGRYWKTARLTSRFPFYKPGNPFVNKIGQDITNLREQSTERLGLFPKDEKDLKENYDVIEVHFQIKIMPWYSQIPCWFLGTTLGFVTGAVPGIRGNHHEGYVVLRHKSHRDKTNGQEEPRRKFDIRVRFNLATTMEVRLSMSTEKRKVPFQPLGVEEVSEYGITPIRFGAVFDAMKAHHAEHPWSPYDNCQTVYLMLGQLVGIPFEELKQNTKRRKVESSCFKALDSQSFCE